MQNNHTIIKIKIKNLCPSFVVKQAAIRKLIKELCLRFKIRNVFISIAIVDDKYIRKVNRRFIGKSSTTDVISFDLSDENENHKVFEFVVNARQAERAAKRFGHSNEAELALYVVHGFLHNAGFDDIKSSDAKRMHKLEDKILTELGYGAVFGTKAIAKSGEQI